MNGSDQQGYIYIDQTVQHLQVK